MSEQIYNFENKTREIKLYCWNIVKNDTKLSVIQKSTRKIGI